MSILRLESITQRFGGLIALDSVSLEVAARGVTAIIGPNGAGKTTLFNVISGFRAPTEGHVIFADEDITGYAAQEVAKRGLIRTFQLVQLFETLTVLENIKVGRHLHTRGGLANALLPFRSRAVEAQVDAVLLLQRHDEQSAAIGLALDFRERSAERLCIGGGGHEPQVVRVLALVIVVDLDMPVHQARDAF